VSVQKINAYVGARKIHVKHSPGSILAVLDDDSDGFRYQSCMMIMAYKTDPRSKAAAAAVLGSRGRNVPLSKLMPVRDGSSQE
jgi:hypothetical protein